MFWRLRNEAGDGHFQTAGEYRLPGTSVHYRIMTGTPDTSLNRHSLTDRKPHHQTRSHIGHHKQTMQPDKSIQPRGRLGVTVVGGTSSSKGHSGSKRLCDILFWNHIMISLRSFAVLVNLKWYSGPPLHTLILIPCNETPHHLVTAKTIAIRSSSVLEFYLSADLLLTGTSTQRLSWMTQYDALAEFMFRLEKRLTL